jgi:hypothetical protein
MPRKKKEEVTIEHQETYLEKNVPYIHNSKELSTYLRPVYIVDDLLRSYEVYDSFMKKISNLLRGSFCIRQCREYPIVFKFYPKDKNTYTLQFRHFYINMILWRAFVELNGLNVLNESFIIDCENDIPNIEDYINYKLIEVLRDYHIKSTTINSTISEVLYNLRMISLDYSMIMNLNFSLNTFIDVYQNNDRIRELMESKFDKGLQPYEIEDILHSYEDEEIKLYKAMKDNPVGVILRANTGIKHKQFAEFTISQGLKPTLSGETIPLNVDNSTLIRGADRPSYYYINAISSRKLTQWLSYIVIYSKIYLLNCWDAYS